MEPKTRFYAGASCIQSTLESEDGAAEERGIEFKGLYSLFDCAVNLVFLLTLWQSSCSKQVYTFWGVISYESVYTI